MVKIVIIRWIDEWESKLKYDKDGGKIMDLTPEMISIGTELATIVGKRSVETIFDKIRTVKEKGNKEEIIRSLEAIINELIEDKNYLIQISQAYEEKLMTQKITQTEIDYITESIVPLLEEFLKQSNPDEAEKIQEGINLIKPILSKETLNIMQILGFNFKKAIGEPLTEWLSSVIRANIVVVDKNLSIQELSLKREIEYLKLCQNEEAFNRLSSVNESK